MLTPEQNERVTRVGAGTPMGDVFRRYWIPALLSSELPEADGAPIRVRLLGEDLIAFRDSDGNVGLVDAFCPHRRAPMFFGRNEECGLRCVYHGWKFDRNGTCVDMPSEPPGPALSLSKGSLFKTKVTIAAYPTYEAGGAVWTYMGPRDRQPPLPDYEWMRAPAPQRHLSKTFEGCNWLQGLEGGIDSAHSSFLHNMDLTNTAYLRTADGAPRLEVEPTGYGFRYASTRRLPERDYVRVYQFMMPSQQSRGFILGNRLGEAGHIPTIHGHLWIPIDDVSTMVWNWIYSFDPAQPLTQDWAEWWEEYSGRAPHHFIPGTFKLKLNPANDYQIDRALQKTQTFTGIEGANTQDFAVQEGMGPICDRSREHLGTTDRAVIVARQLLLEACDEVAAGRDPRGTDPAAYRNARAADNLVPHDADWRSALDAELTARF